MLLPRHDANRRSCRRRQRRQRGEPTTSNAADCGGPLRFTRDACLHGTAARSLLAFHRPRRSPLSLSLRVSLSAAPSSLGSPFSASQRCGDARARSLMDHLLFTLDATVLSSAWWSTLVFWSRILVCPSLSLSCFPLLRFGEHLTHTRGHLFSFLFVYSSVADTRAYSRRLPGTFLADDD